MSSLKTAASDKRPKATKIGRPPAGEIEKRKKTILAVATKLFVANGYQNTTLTDVGKAAGVTKRTIYDHIGDKDTLFRTVCMECLPEDLELHFEPPSGGENAHEALKNLAQTIIDYSLSDDRIQLGRMLVVERQRFPDLVRQAVLVMKDLYTQLIENVLKDLAEHDLLAPSDNMEKIAYYFYDIIVGSVHTQMLFDLVHEPPSEDEIDQRVDIFLFGYQASQVVKKKTR